MEIASLPWTFFWFLLSIIVASRLFSRSRSQKGLNLPPSPWGLPVIGHLHLLKHPVHQNFYKYSQKLGPIFSLRFGSRLAVVVNSPEIAEECFTRNDVVLANRPTLLHSKYLAYDNTIVIVAPHGDHWKNLRKLMAIEVFSTGRLNAFTALRHEEMKIILSNLSSREFSKVKLKALFSGLNLNVVTRMIAGKRYFGKGYDDSQESIVFRGIASEVSRYSGAWNPIEYLAFLRWIDYKDYEKNLKRIYRNLDDLLQGLVDERRRMEKRGNVMIDQLLTLQESQPEYYDDTTIKGLALVMITAGTDTTSVTMEWAWASLLNNPEILMKAQAEIDTHVGQDRLIEEKDLPNLKYLQAIITEALRLFPAGPLLIPHMASENCKIAGYDVPANTIVLPNAWAIGRDPKTWDDPLTFKPERFLGDGEAQISKVITFGIGRRACPGQGLAQRVMGVGLGSLIQCFEWKRVTEEPVDFTEGEGITMTKLEPLEGMCKNREIMNKLFADGVIL